MQWKNADVFFPNFFSNDFNSTKPEGFWLLLVINPSARIKLAGIFKGAWEGEAHNFFLSCADGVHSYWMQTELLFSVAIFLLWALCGQMPLPD